MEHLVIGAAHAAHTLEYARSWERAARVPPRLWGWEALCQAPLPAAAPGRPLELPPGSEDGLLIRLCAPTVEERAGLLRYAQVQGGAPSAERPEEAFTGLCRALVQLTSQLESEGVTARYAVTPASVQLLLDHEQRRRALAADGVPTPGLWLLRGGPALRYQTLRERLRRLSGSRVRVRPAQNLGPAPLLYLWGGPLLRARGDLRWTQSGVRHSDTLRDLDEAELRPLLLALLAGGALVEEEWPAEEIGGQRAHLTLLVTGQRVVLGAATSADPFVAERRRLVGAADFPALRRLLPVALWDRMEQTLTALVRRQGCAALVVEVALAPHREDFVVLDVDPFAVLWPELRDATGWSVNEHLVRALMDREGSALRPGAAADDLRPGAAAGQ